MDNLDAILTLTRKYPDRVKYFREDVLANDFLTAIGCKITIGKESIVHGIKMHSEDVVWIKYGEGGDTIPLSKFDRSFTYLLEQYLYHSEHEALR